MASNSIGHILKIHSFGESHGPLVGVVIDGLPAGLTIDESFIQNELNRRKPGQSSISTSRKEEDLFTISSGVFEGKSTGHPVHIGIPNTNSRKKDYTKIARIYRPSHADYTYEQKYGIRDPFGGGRASARITAGWVAAGAIAKMLLKELSDIHICSYVNQIHTIGLDPDDPIDLDTIEKNAVRCPNTDKASEMIKAIEQAKNEGDSLGGIVRTIIQNCPVGLGEPIFDKLHANLGKAVLSINACKGIQFGAGFDSVLFKGSELNDEWYMDGENIRTRSNHSGGIQGGISNGEEIRFDAVFRPTSSISGKQQTLNKDLEAVELEIQGRHDPCVVPRAIPIVEAMTALVLADHLLILNNSSLKHLT